MASLDEKKSRGSNRKRFELKRLMCSNTSVSDDHRPNSSPRDQSTRNDENDDDWEAQHRSCWASFQQTFMDDEDSKKSLEKRSTPNFSQATNTFKGLTVRLLCRSRAEEDEEDVDFISISEKANATQSSSTGDLSASITDCSITDSSTHTSNTDENNEVPIEEVAVKPKPLKGLRFADEVGQDIETIHYTDTEFMEPLSVQRIMILLLSPEDHRFELIQVSYHKTKERMTVKDVTGQLPQYAADKVLQRQTYTGLAYRRRTTNDESSSIRTEELLHTLCIQDYSLVKNEVLVALVDGYSSRELMTMAETLLQNKNVRKAAKSAKRSRRAIQSLHPSTVSNNEKQ